jgi:tRNA (uracil-5-)-methyltransferase TRM9
MGVDRSLGLLKFAQYAGESTIPRDVILGDVRDLIWRQGIFVSQSTDMIFVCLNRQDFAISIATIHHLATPERRVDAIMVSRKLSGISLWPDLLILRTSSRY